MVLLVRVFDFGSQSQNLSKSRSAPSSPSKVKKSVKLENFSPRRTASCNQISNFEIATMSTLQQDLKPLTGSRAGLKQWAARTLNNLQSAKESSSLDA